MNRVVMRGAAGGVKWGYYPAADLGAWSLTIDPSSGGQLSAAVVSHDGYRLSQQPLTFVVRRSSGQAWTWPIESLTVQNGSITARLGPQE